MAIFLFNNAKSSASLIPPFDNPKIVFSKIFMDSNYAKYLLEETRKNYNATAEDYTRTRAHIPEDIKLLASYTREGEKILDSGCASGRFFGVLKSKKVHYFGVDLSDKLIDIAKDKYPEADFRVADALNLPFPDDFFDKVYSISVLHNIPSKELQLQYLKEAKRALKPGGTLILRVWDFWKRKEGWRLFLKYSLLKFFNKSKLDFFDVFVPWKDDKGKIITQRYFHCFTEKRIITLIKEANFKIKKVWRDGKDPRTNIYLVAEK